MQTNRAAPNWRVVRIDPARPDEAHWVEVLPERREPLQSANTAGGKLFATYLQDVASRAYVFTSTALSKTRSCSPDRAPREVSGLKRR